MTACHLLSGNDELKKLKLVLLPMAKEILNNTNDVTSSIADLKVFIKQLEDEHKVKFDIDSILLKEAPQNPDYWPFDII